MIPPNKSASCPAVYSRGRASFTANVRYLGLTPGLTPETRTSPVDPPSDPTEK